MLVLPTSWDQGGVISSQCAIRCATNELHVHCQQIDVREHQFSGHHHHSKQGHGSGQLTVVYLGAGNPTLPSTVLYAASARGQGSVLSFLQVPVWCLGPERSLRVS